MQALVTEILATAKVEPGNKCLDQMFAGLSFMILLLSAVTQLSVKRVVSLMMGAWFLGTSYSEILAAELNKLAAIDTQGGVISDIAGAMSLYEQLFIFSAQIGIVVAAVFLVLAPLMKRMMHEKD